MPICDILDNDDVQISNKKERETSTVVTVILVLSVIAIGAYFFIVFYYFILFQIVDLYVPKTVPKEFYDAKEAEHLINPFFLKHVAIVTYASEHFFDNVMNLIGSIHTWAPGMDILVYDLGLNATQLFELHCTQSVSVQRLHFADYPVHVSNLYNYAWKAIVISDALSKSRNILVLDAGMELRGPINEILGHLISPKGEEVDGFFFIQSTKDTFRKYGFPKTLEKLKLSKTMSSELQDVPMCYGGIQGYSASQKIVNDIIGPMLECALDSRCIDPVGSGHENHRYEMTVLSALIRTHYLEYYCHNDDKYREDKPLLVSANPFQFNQSTTIFFRRWRYPKPYTRSVSKLSLCPGLDINTLEKYRTHTFVETMPTMRFGSDQEVIYCLQNHLGDGTFCQPEIDAIVKKQDETLCQGSPEFVKQETHDGYVLLFLRILYEKFLLYWDLILFGSLLMVAARYTAEWYLHYHLKNEIFYKST